MTMGETLLPEFDQEMAVTRRVLERAPSDKGQWKPHPKSFAIGHLAQLVSWMPGWIASTLTSPALDISKAAGYSFEPTETLVKGFDANVHSARAALAAAKDADFGRNWSLKVGERVVFTAPAGVVVRQHISHLVHHRAQLGVYLRLLDIPVPQMYGPTADDRGFLA